MRLFSGHILKMLECIKIVSKVGHSFIPHSTFTSQISTYQTYYISTTVQTLKITNSEQETTLLKNFLVIRNSGLKKKKRKQGFTVKETKCE